MSSQQTPEVVIAKPTAPEIVRRGKAFVIKRQSHHGPEYYNAKQRRWVPSSQVHGGSYDNPKASYFRSVEAAEKLLEQARQR